VNLGKAAAADHGCVICGQPGSREAHRKSPFSPTGAAARRPELQATPPETITDRAADLLRRKRTRRAPQQLFDYGGLKMTPPCPASPRGSQRQATPHRLGCAPVAVQFAAGSDPPRFIVAGPVSSAGPRSLIPLKLKSQRVAFHLRQRERHGAWITVLRQPVGSPARPDSRSRVAWPPCRMPLPPRRRASCPGAGSGTARPLRNRCVWAAAYHQRQRRQLHRRAALTRFHHHGVNVTLDMIHADQREALYEAQRLWRT